MILLPILFMINSGLCALNVGLYAASGDPLNLGAGIFVGLMAQFIGLSYVRVDR